MKAAWRLAIDILRLPEDVFRWGQDFRRKHLTHLWRMVHLVPPFFAFVTLWLLAYNGQLREIYLGIAESHQWLKLLFGLASIGIIAWALFTAYIRLTGNRVRALYGSMSSVYLNPWLVRARDLLALTWAALPFVGLLFGFWQMRNALPDAMLYFLASLVFAGVVLCILWANRTNRHLGDLAICTAGLVLLALFLVVPFLDAPYLLWVTHILGPLAMVGLQLLAILAVVAGLAALRHWLVPILAVGLLTLVLSTYWATAPPPDASAHASAGREEPEVVRQFKKWLAERTQDIQDFNGKFPVFIVAAQGGGIYAASATTTFLAKLQEECPSFSRHVFAVSGVSGGAVGGAIYHAHADDRQTRPLSKCRAMPPREAPHELMTGIRVAVTRDHLSPVLGALIPELAAGLLADSARQLLPTAWMRAIADAVRPVLPASLGNWRASALETSLACAHIDPDKFWSSDDGCFDARSRLRLRKRLSASWRDGKGPHALILTTTRAEAGSTVAFAPFGLRDLGEPSLEAFSDPPYERGPDASTLVEAAVASARFPGVLPPYSLTRGERQWNFVDGGYADDSGVAVAGAIYRALRDAAERNAEMREVDVRLILLTSDSGDDAMRAAVGSTTLVEFRVPLEAVFNVRAGIGTREVVRAVNQLSDRASTGIDSRVFLVQFRTPFLGWMISRTTNDEIASIVASRDPCPDVHAQPQPAAPKRGQHRSIRELSRDNGCQLSYIRRLLSGGG